MKIERRMIPEWGITLDGVWIPFTMLEDLSEQDVWASQSGHAYNALNAEQARVLTEHGLAERETRGGYHRGLKLNQFMDTIEWPDEEKGNAHD